MKKTTKFGLSDITIGSGEDAITFDCIGGDITTLTPEFDAMVNMTLSGSYIAHSHTGLMALDVKPISPTLKKYFKNVYMRGNLFSERGKDEKF